MHSFVRTLALTVVALLLAAGGAWACCDNGLVDCCDMTVPSISEHCSDTQAMSMDCSLDQAVDVNTDAVGGKTVEPPLMAGAAATLAPTAPHRSFRAADTFAATAGTDAKLYTLFASLRL